ncbi:hypothetical protein NP493_442g00009 [Ridgeia piscesae]|uniref:Uncharacterized protein n=1 Tax=Ridgeia piscesae TaxID=27915 RepID=A0AAD9KZX4_RIDPI|nr:hypothetical protein NP493_442g00009 [Ridgeia piscesae]
MFQVHRMLPGGLDVIGLFAVGSPDMMQSAQAKLRQVLFATHKMLRQGQPTPKTADPCITDRILLQICSVTRKITCRSFDVADPKCSARPADWKYQTFLDRWQRLDSTMSIDWFIPVAETALCDTLSSQIQNGLSGYCENVWNSLATIDGRILPAEAMLSQSSQSSGPPHGGKRRKQKGEQPTPAAVQRYTVALFAQMPPSDVVPQATITDCGAQMIVRGNISSRAFVHGKATVAEATQAVKADIVRSLTSRCQLLCEDLLQTEEDQDPKVLYETPIRVFAPIPSTCLSLCDYMFQDEATTDCVDRFRELLDLVIDADDIQLDAERIPSEEDLAKSEEFDIESVDDNSDPTSSRNLSRLGGWLLNDYKHVRS